MIAGVAAVLAPTVGPIAGIPMLGLDALSSAAYGPEAALTIMLSVGMLGMRFLTRGPTGHRDPAREIYARFCRRLARAAGVVRRENEGPLDYARRAVAALPAQEVEIRRVTDLYVGFRYAENADAPSALRAFGRAVKDFRPVAPPVA